MSIVEEEKVTNDLNAFSFTLSVQIGNTNLADIVNLADLHCLDRCGGPLMN